MTRRTEETRLNTLRIKKFLVEEIKKQQRRKEGKKVEKSSTKKELKCSFLKKEVIKKNPRFVAAL